MKQSLLLGIISLLISLLSCSKIDSNLEWIEFGCSDTKAVKSFNWERGDNVCIYSLVDGVITYKYVSTISNANGNTCKIKALVDKNSTQYFATFPKNAVNCNVGEPLDDEKLNVIYNGKYRDVSIMTCYANKNQSDLWFEQRLSLLQIKNLIGTVNGNVVIESSLPVNHSFTMNSGSYYIPISYKNENVKITFNTDNLSREVTLPTEVGKIYVSEYTIN